MPTIRLNGHPVEIPSAVIHRPSLIDKDKDVPWTPYPDQIILTLMQDHQNQMAFLNTQPLSRQNKIFTPYHGVWTKRRVRSGFSNWVDAHLDDVPGSTYRNTTVTVIDVEHGAYVRMRLSPHRAVHLYHPDLPKTLTPSLCLVYAYWYARTLLLTLGAHGDPLLPHKEDALAYIVADQLIRRWPTRSS